MSSAPSLTFLKRRKKREPAAWSAQGLRTIEIVAPSGPGGTTDRTARVVARLLTTQKLVDVPVNVVNRPGGSGSNRSPLSPL